MTSPALLRFLRPAGVAALVAGLAGAGQTAVAQGAASEADLKAAIVFNFAQFTRWPAEPHSPQEPFTLCYAGEDVGAAFTQLSSRRLHERPVQARRVPAEGPFAGCRLMYWSDGRTQRQVPAAGSALLTVGSGGDFLQRGGMIQMQVENARLVFSVNVDAARAAGLQISSKLLRLAKSVQGSVE